MKHFRNVMLGFFRKIGGKDSSNEAEKEAANEALNVFKNRKTGETPRFFKSSSRGSGNHYIEVDEEGALVSEWVSSVHRVISLLFFDLY